MLSRMSCHRYPPVVSSIANSCGCVQEGIVLDIRQHIWRHILHHSCRKPPTKTVLDTAMG
jgi:hypothetical protein